MSQQPSQRGRPRKKARWNSTPINTIPDEANSNQSVATLKLQQFLEDTGQLYHPKEKYGIQQEKVENVDVKRMIKRWKHSMELKVILNSYRLLII